MTTALLILVFLLLLGGESYGLRRGNLLVSDGSAIGLLALVTLWAIG